MSSTSAMLTGLSGMNAHARRLEVIGNNIANVNTHGFKSSRALFATHFTRTLSIGHAPLEEIGGTNPTQIGHGVAVAGTQKDFRTGAISGTGDARDLAIDGNGFFHIQRGPDTLFTRVGAFRPDAENNLVTIDGDRVLGYGVDANFNIMQGALVGINIPVGTLSLAQATQNAHFAGNLNAAGAVATHGANILFGPAAQAPGTGFSLIPTATVPPAPGNVLEPGSLLSEITDPQSPGTTLFAPGQSLEIRGAEKGQRTLSPAQFPITAASTVEQLMAFLATALGLEPAAANNAGPPPGVALDPASGQISITGNSGGINDLELNPANIRILDGAGQLLRTPFSTDKTADAQGESVRTTFVAYDSLGNPVSVDVGFVLDSRDNAGTVWRYHMTSTDGGATSPPLGTGLVRFDTLGQIEMPATIQVAIPRTGTGAQDPLTVTLHLAQGAHRISALASQESQIASTFQDGAPMGTLAAFGVQDDGRIIGSFTNGIIRTLGLIPLATFQNPEGLIDQGGSVYRVGPNSGLPVVVEPGEAGTGRLVSGALELSNVDLGQEFINMILTSTGYSASSRVIRTSDELLQQLLLLFR
jgi:flagellar hook protein FlgE